VIGRRLRENIRILENQFAFILGRSTIEANHLIQRLMELYKYMTKDLYMVFIDLEKAHDKILQKYFRGAWRRKTSQLLILELLELCMTE